jgi:hypothetical protein
MGPAPNPGKAGQTGANPDIRFIGIEEIFKRNSAKF